jgi:hypothetical protein
VRTCTCGAAAAAARSQLGPEHGPVLDALLDEITSPEGRGLLATLQRVSDIRLLRHLDGEMASDLGVVP